MTEQERVQLAALTQRLYGGPMDGEKGDVVALKEDVAAIRVQLTRLATAAAVIAAVVSFVGFSGLIWLIRAVEAVQAAPK